MAMVIAKLGSSGCDAYAVMIKAHDHYWISDASHGLGILVHRASNV
jgi:hypothetical protein